MPPRRRRWNRGAGTAAAHIRAQQTAQQAFSRLLGRSTAREGVLAICERPPRPHVVVCEDRKGTVIYESETTTW